MGFSIYPLSSEVSSRLEMMVEDVSVFIPFASTTANEKLPDKGSLFSSVMRIDILILSRA